MRASTSDTSDTSRCQEASAGLMELAHVPFGLLLQVIRYLPEAARVGFIFQPHQAFLHKPPYPLVAMPTAQANHGGSLGDRHTVSQQQQHPATSSQPSRCKGQTLPRQQRQAFRRGEADGERGFASTRHREPSQKEYYAVSCQHDDRATGALRHEGDVASALPPRPRGARDWQWLPSQARSPARS